MRRLPSLNALLAFETVARTGSVVSAAEELSVTSGAVSRQIRVLEDDFGVALFVRDGRGLALTTAGAGYFERVTAHFDGLREASSRLRGNTGRTVLRLRSYTTFATRWLIPRLTAFQLDRPDMDVRLTTSSDWEGMGDCDAAIRLGDGQWPEHEAVALVPNVLVPVCSPTLIQPSRPSDATWLAEQTILSVRARPNDWRLWSEGVGIDPKRLTRSRTFESSTLTYQASIDGHGVALAQKILVAAELEDGRLVAPLDGELDRGDETYYFVFAKGTRKRRQVTGLVAALLNPPWPDPRRDAFSSLD